MAQSAPMTISGYAYIGEVIYILALIPINCVHGQTICRQLDDVHQKHIKVHISCHVLYTKCQGIVSITHRCPVKIMLSFFSYRIQTTVKQMADLPFNGQVN